MHRGNGDGVKYGRRNFPPAPNRPPFLRTNNYTHLFDMFERARSRQRSRSSLFSRHQQTRDPQLRRKQMTISSSLPPKWEIVRNLYSVAVERGLCQKRVPTNVAPIPGGPKNRSFMDRAGCCLPGTNFPQRALFIYAHSTPLGEK